VPLSFDVDRSSPPYLRPGKVGLAQTLDSVLRFTGGTWVGCLPNEDTEALVEVAKEWRTIRGYSIAPVFLESEEKSDYQGFSNAVMWPLFHSLAAYRKLATDCWSGYCKVNGKIAAAVQIVSRPEDFVWVHDYQLMMVASLLRANGWRRRIGYFHHIPFPRPSVLEKLPWRVELLHALLQFDLIGFQTDGDRRNFIASLQEFLPLPGPVEAGGKYVLRVLDRAVKVGTYPVGIDCEALSTEASTPAVLAATEGIKKQLCGTRIVLSVDPLQVTMGICERLMAYQRLLECRPELRGCVTMLQIVIPSSERNSELDELKLEIEDVVDKINGKFGNPDWTPVHYYQQRLAQSQLIAFYRAADVAVITPLRDGMNLVAKEFCASRCDERGVLILSEFAGAAEELKAGALLVNPYDIDRVARLIDRALQMNESEQQERMSALRSHVQRHNVFHWSRSFQADAALLALPSWFRNRPMESAHEKNRRSPNGL
ncbi:MAG TPA: trehalose-6-phosphate synthase, partial [Terriglobia bacterium]|nr:trehalose-6-phosphate synthase [Terriglobia bacterium]